MKQHAMNRVIDLINGHYIYYCDLRYDREIGILFSTHRQF